MSIFSSVPIFRPKTNKINLSYQNIMTTSFGRLTPCLLEECLPGDVFRAKTELFIRFQPLLAPIFDQCDATLHYYFVPSRLCFQGFYKFLVDEEISNGNPAVIPYSSLNSLVARSADYLFPGPHEEGFKVKVDKSLIDYLNIPTTQFTCTWNGNGYFESDAPEIPVNIMPLISYYLIWWKYYRDENLEDTPLNQQTFDALKVVIEQGGEVYNFLLDELVKLRYRAYKKDYFTSALPWPQKGDDVLIPVSREQVVFDTTPNTIEGTLERTYGAPDGVKMQINDGEQMHDVDIHTTGNTSMTINDLRTSMRVQQLLENNARGGTRQQEFIKAHWGVFAKDARINDPEYIGGVSVPIQISEVLSQVANQQAGSSSTANSLGQLGGHGITAGFAASKKYRVTEHGYLIGILSIRPKASYFQGLPRMFSHLERYQYFFPELSHLGEQEILNKELMVEPQDPGEERADPDGTFGYTPRYAEYKFHGNEIHGDFRDTLKYWHMARIFDWTPGLNKDFISVNPNDQGQNRVFTYVNGDYDQILVQLYHHNGMLRKMPYYGIPKF